MMSHPLRILFLLLAGWVNRKQHDGRQQDGVP
jgi:hypothetical protein